ncbi:MAG: hypothetical protein IT449_02210 [Phycisphaerales bacterium]|nr:hypothetical protein [Phycisphaerales bacterium]
MWLAAVAGGFAPSFASAADITIEGDITSRDLVDGYVAMILDYDGTDNIHVRVVVNSFTGLFEGAIFGHSNAVSGWPGMTGGSPAFGLGTSFATAHMSVRDNGAGTVTLTLTNLDGNPNRSVTFTRGGWSPRPGGSDVGFGMTSNKCSLDNFKFSNSPVCDAFERDDGELGRLWRIEHGTAEVKSKEARGDGAAFVIWVSEGCGECSGVERFSAKCVDREGVNIVSAKVTRGLPGGLVALTLSGGAPTEEKVINNKGKAKTKWVGIADDGLQFVFAAFSCGYTLEARPICP